jgi:hypothetical protein
MSATRRATKSLAGQPVERGQAALGGRVVPGSEGLGRLDLEPHEVGRDARAVVAAVDDEAPGPDRGQLGADLGDPVAVVEASGGEVRRAVQLREEREARGIGHSGEMAADLPDPAAVVAVVQLGAERRRRQGFQRLAQRGGGHRTGDGRAGEVEGHARRPVRRRCRRPSRSGS